jgi:hypothetical protein
MQEEHESHAVLTRVTFFFVNRAQGIDAQSRIRVMQCIERGDCLKHPHGIPPCYAQLPPSSVEIPNRFKADPNWGSCRHMKRKCSELSTRAHCMSDRRVDSRDVANVTPKILDVNEEENITWFWWAPLVCVAKTVH